MSDPTLKLVISGLQYYYLDRYNYITLHYSTNVAL